MPHSRFPTVDPDGIRSTPNPTHLLRDPAEFRAWLNENHNTATELWLGYYKKSTGRASVTWEETVDEALRSEGLMHVPGLEAYAHKDAHEGSG